MKLYLNDKMVGLVPINIKHGDAVEVHNVGRFEIGRDVVTGEKWLWTSDPVQAEKALEWLNW